MKKKKNNYINGIKIKRYIFKALPGTVSCWDCALDSPCWDNPDLTPCPNRIWKERLVYYAFANLKVKVRIPRKMKKQLKKHLGLSGTRVGNRKIIIKLYLCGAG